jgi:hypothetical protein
MSLKQFIFLGCFLFGTVPLSISQDLDALLAAEMGEETNYTSATFKATRILNGHSIERMQEGQLDFRIHHRFGRLNSGGYELWGLDQANIHFSLEYGINDWIMLGVGRGTYEKTYDGFIKLSPLRQSTGAKEMPISLTILSGLYMNSLKWDDETRTYSTAHRFEYTNQVLIARKFSKSISIQIMPSHLHRNLVISELDPNDLFAMGAGARIKLNNRFSFNAEYYYIFNRGNEFLTTPLYSPLSFGFDIETGGHVFQLIFTNSLAMTEHGFIGNTTGNWLEGDIHFGFNISRVFSVKK